MNKLDRVRVKQTYSRILNDDMKKWIVDHKDRIFKVENIHEGSIKLYGVYFWITEDLLEYE